MIAHPGKTLQFMGNEFAQFIEWNNKQGLDWLLLQYPIHQQATAFNKKLNHLYLDTPPLWEVDFSWEGFSWISNDDYTQSVIAFRRFDQKGNEIIAVCNFVPVQRDDYRIGVPYGGVYAEIFNTDDTEFGGSGITNGDNIKSVEEPMHGLEHSISLTLPPMSVIYLKIKRRAPAKKTAPKAAEETPAEKVEKPKAPAKKKAPCKKKTTAKKGKA